MKHRFYVCTAIICVTLQNYILTKIILMYAWAGIGWSLLQRHCKSREGTILSANFENGIWVWIEVYQRGRQGTYIPRDTAVPSSTSEGLQEGSEKTSFLYPRFLPWLYLFSYFSLLLFCFSAVIFMTYILNSSWFFFVLQCCWQVP